MPKTLSALTAFRTRKRPTREAPWEEGVISTATVHLGESGLDWYAYVGGDPVNYVDPWGLWESRGDGTAVAVSGDTLWGLAEEITGSGLDWSDIEGHSGAPETLQIGEAVDYSALLAGLTPLTRPDLVLSGAIPNLEGDPTIATAIVQAATTSFGQTATGQEVLMRWRSATTRAGLVQ